MSALRCRCCRMLLAPANPGPLCGACASGHCRRGRTHRREVRDVNARSSVAGPAPGSEAGRGGGTLARGRGLAPARELDDLGR